MGRYWMHFGSLLMVAVFGQTAFADRYDEWVQHQRSREVGRRLQILGRHFENVERRFLINLDAFQARFGSFQSQPECRDYQAKSATVQGSRQVCNGRLCVNVTGGRGDAYKQTDPLLYELERRDEMLESCRVVLSDGRVCDVDMIISKPHLAITSFGGYCVDEAKNARHLSIPVRNIKFD